MTFDEAMPTPDGNTIATMSDWESYWVGGLGGAAGVVAGRGGELSPSINSGARTVSAASGGALVRGFYVNNPATTTMAVPTQSAGDRVDRLALRLDRTASVAADWLKPIILQGTSGSATPPALAATDNASWDLPIARWTTKADTTLTGLVDERLALGGSFMVFKSANRPSASPPRLGYETDTGRLLLANGSAWAAVIDDTGWVNVPVVGNWAAGGFTPKIVGGCQLHGVDAGRAVPDLDPGIRSGACCPENVEDRRRVRGLHRQDLRRSVMP